MLEHLQQIQGKDDVRQRVNEGGRLSEDVERGQRRPDKDSDKRQRAAIDAFAQAAGYEIVEEFYDEAVSGADPVTDRKGFADMLERLLSNGARTIIVESPDRFARDLMVQLVGHDTLKAKEIALIAASAPTFFVEDTPTAVLVRQVLGAVAQFDKATTVARLAAARRRKRIATGVKVGGHKSYAELNPEAVALAKRLHRYPVNNRKRSLREIAAELEAQGCVSVSGKRYAATAISRMLAS